MTDKNKKILFITGGITVFGIIVYLLLKPKKAASTTPNLTTYPTTTTIRPTVPQGTSGVNVQVNAADVLGKIGGWFSGSSSTSNIVDSDSHGNYKEADGTWYTYQGTPIDNYVGDQVYS